MCKNAQQRYDSGASEIKEIFANFFCGDDVHGRRRPACAAPPPCWTLSQNISKLEASFRPLAAMITIQAKNSLLPMVRYNHSKIWRHSQKFWNFWYVHPEKFTWESIDNVKIPFHPSQYDQQYRLLNYVISHRYSYEMLLTIMSMSTERSNQRGDQPA